MSDEAVKVVVAGFSNEDEARRALSALNETRRLMNTHAAAVVSRDESGQLHIKEIKDMGGGRGATYGGIIDGTVGLIAGPAGVVVGAGVGAAIGGIAAKVTDGGFKDERLEKFAESLEPGASFVVAVVEEKWVETVEKQLIEANADVVSLALDEDVAKLIGSD